MNLQPDFGAFVISLDFELHWGVRDHFTTTGEYRENLLGARRAVPAMLGLFEEFDVGATWATVGFLFAESKQELKNFEPAVLPDYANQNLSPYHELIGDDETVDPLHFAPSLIEQIKQTAKQEIGTHTFSHYYCLETGNTPQAFEADLQSAIEISKKIQIRPASIVFPRNQHNSDYDEILRRNQIFCYRGNQRAWMYQISETKQKHLLYRAARLADNYLNVAGTHAFEWRNIWQNGLANVPASLFLRPVSRKLRSLEGLRKKRIANGLMDAAKNHRIFHLWWHPHNFGVNLNENIAFLRSILIEFQRLREQHSLRSLTMSEVAAEARAFAQSDSVLK